MGCLDDGLGGRRGESHALTFSVHEGSDPNLWNGADKQPFLKNNQQRMEVESITGVGFFREQPSHSTHYPPPPEKKYIKKNQADASQFLLPDGLCSFHHCSFYANYDLF